MTNLFAELDAVIVQAEKAKEKTQEALEMRRLFEEERQVLVRSVGVADYEEAVIANLNSYKAAMQNRDTKSQALHDLTNGDTLKLLEAEITTEVEVEYAASGGRSNAEQRRAEVLKRLSANVGYQTQLEAERKARAEVSQADGNILMAEKSLRVAMALLESKVTQLRVLC